MHHKIRGVPGHADNGVPGRVVTLLAFGVAMKFDMMDSARSWRGRWGMDGGRGGRKDGVRGPARYIRRTRGDLASPRESDR